MNITLQGAMSQTQWNQLVKITELVNANLPACDHKTPERVAWRFFCSTLDEMAERGHNRIIRVATGHRDPITAQERRGHGR